MRLKRFGRSVGAVITENLMREQRAPALFHSSIRANTLSSLLEDPRILGITTTLLGDDFNYMGSDGNYYVGDTRWHSDGGHKPEDPTHIKIAFYLDPINP